jgi:hypothetical protein
MQALQGDRRSVVSDLQILGLEGEIGLLALIVDNQVHRDVVDVPGRDGRLLL